MATIDLRYVESRFPKTVAGGRDFNITHIFRNVGDSGKCRIEMTRDGEKITRELDLGAGEDYPITEKFTLWDNILLRYAVDLFGLDPGNVAHGASYNVSRAECEAILARFRITSRLERGHYSTRTGDPGTCYYRTWQRKPSWITLPHIDFNLPIEACFPKLELPHIDAPPIVAAGESFRVLMTAVNTGCIGQVRLKVGEEVVDEREWGSDEQGTINLAYDMPYDDMYLPLTAEVLGRGKEWTRTAAIPLEIKAGFAKTEIGAFDYPEGLRAGEGFSMSVPVRNVGYRGETGLRIFDGETEVERMERIDRDAYITPTFSSEMPPVSLIRMRLNSIHLGRNRAVVIDDTKTIEIPLVNTLNQLEKVVNLYGGYAERNTFTGFVAGKNVRISGIPTVPGTGGPLGGLIPYGGYILSGDLGPGDIATIEFDELYFLRVETVKGIATIRASKLLERDTKIYEYSVMPTPAMMFQPVNLLTTSLRKVAPSLEVVR